MTVTLDQQILEVREELVDRRRLYAWRVKHRRMKQSEADRRIAAMLAVLTTLEQLKDASAPPPAPPPPTRDPGVRIDRKNR